MNEEFNSILAKITKEISAEFPEIKIILESASKGELSEQEALAKLMVFTKENPIVANKIAEIFMENANPDGEIETHDEIIVVPPKPPTKKDNADISTVWEDRSAENKRARFNPQYESALVERLQFDNDVPELRTGALPKDAKPAVPVVTDSRNPVIVGDQLKKASEEVRKEADELTQKYLSKLKSENTDLVKKENNTELDIFSAPQPKGYEAGKLPVARNVKGISIKDLINLSNKERKENVWGFISTTQGRRSITKVMSEIVEERLSLKGIEVKCGEITTGGKLHSSANWIFSIKSASEVQDRFSFIETASYSIAYHLISNMKDHEQGNIYTLEITPINSYSSREVGWGARLILEK